MLSHVWLCNHIDYIWFFHTLDYPSKNTGMGCHFLLQGIFLRDWTCISCLLHWQIDSLPLNFLGSYQKQDYLSNKEIIHHNISTTKWRPRYFFFFLSLFFFFLTRWSQYPRCQQLHWEQQWQQNNIDENCSKEYILLNIK